jgi:hypothetical protein
MEPGKNQRLLLSRKSRNARRLIQLQLLTELHLLMLLLLQPMLPLPQLL